MASAKDIFECVRGAFMTTRNQISTRSKVACVREGWRGFMIENKSQWVTDEVTYA